MEIIVKHLLDKKGQFVCTTSPDTSLLDCAKLMKQYNVGSLLIMEGEQLLGVFYERDMSREVICNEIDPKTTPVSDVMHKEFPIVRSLDSITTVMSVLSNARVRHLPVIDDQVLSGLISIGDVVKYELDAKEEDIEQLMSYISSAVILRKTRMS